MQNRTKPLLAVALGVVTACLLAALAGPRFGLLLGTMQVALPAASLATAIGAPLALLLVKTNTPGRGVLFTLTVAMLLLPLHALAAGWLAALGFQGWVVSIAPGEGVARAWLDGWSGAIFLHALAGVPWTTLLIAASLRAVDSRREEQALLDATPQQVLWRVSLAEAWPGVLAAAGWVALVTSTEIAVTDLFRIRTFAEEIYTQAAIGNLGAGAPADSHGMIGLIAAIGLLSLIGVAVLATLNERLRTALSSEGDRAWRWRLGASGRIVAAIALTSIAMLLVAVPIGSLAYQAGVVVENDNGGYTRVWSPIKLANECLLAPWRHRRELTVSLLLGVVVATSSTVIGAAIAWRLRSGGRMVWVLLAGMAVTLAAPGPLWGLATIRLLNHSLDSPFALLGELYGTWFAPWLVQTVRITPYIALWLWPAAASVSESILAAARSDGAGPIRRALLVAAPMRWPALAAAWIAALALSVGELSATVLVVPPGAPPLSVRLLSLLHYGVEDRVAAICLMLWLGYALASGLVLWLIYRR